MMEPEIKDKKRTGLLGLQVGLRQLLLATLCAGVWFAHWANQDAIAMLEPRLANLQTLSPELIVVDPARTAVVQLPSPWFSTRGWEVYVPTDKVRICIATEDIDQSGFPAKYESALLPKGQYEIQFDEQIENGGHRFLVTKDGQSCLNLEKQFLNASRGSSTSSDVSTQSTQFENHAPIVLIRRRNSVPVPNTPGSSQSPSGPAEGLMLWLQNDR
jgi:hypothetical protein